MAIAIGSSKYLGFLVGPRADAESNFQKPLEKFRERVAYWQGCSRLGASFQTLGFNMFAFSVLNFHSQLYIPPGSVLKVARAWAGRFLHGPRFWLWGVEGHAFFRAGRDLGMKTSPRCPQSSCQALLLKTSRQFMANYTEKLKELERITDRSWVPFVQCLAIIHNTPYHHSTIIDEQAEQLKFTQHMYRARTRKDVNTIAYEMFLTVYMQKGRCKKFCEASTNRDGAHHR